MSKTIKLNGDGKIILNDSGRAEIYVPCMNDTLVFGLPLRGPGTYQIVMAHVSEKGARPTTAQTFSLLDLALQNPDEEHCKDLLTKFKNNYFWTSTENLRGKEDVIVYDNVDGTMLSDRATLLKRMNDGDTAVRVVTYGFATESLSIKEFLENPYVIAQIGNKNMFDIVAKVAKGASKKLPYIRALSPQSQDTKGYTALGSGWSDGRLDLDGIYDDVDNYGYASSIHAIIHNLKKGKKD